MMPLEQQVCSLDLSKRLKELGIKQKSLFYWINPEYTIDNVHEIIYEQNTYINPPKPDFYYSAFTTAEVMNLLPNRITILGNEPFDSFRLRIQKSFIVEHDMVLIDTYIANYHCDTTECSGEDSWLDRTLFPKNMWHENSANTLAKILCFIIQNNLVTDEWKKQWIK
ncbi:MAG: hypothetical protein Q8936_14205 [Bacillota bacterium]|nr:hypothetical protein [Bacillota bacterium]